MLKFLKYNRQYVYILTLWFVSGILFSPLLYVFVPLSLFYLSGKNKYLYIFLGFWIILIFSDARNGFESAKIIKIFYILLLLYIVTQNNRLIIYNNFFYKAFIPFFLAASVSIAFSPIIFVSVQKTLSYFLLLFIIPPFSSFLLKTNKTKFLLGLIYTGVFILFLGFIMDFLDPEFAIYADRFSGVFGNPNGLGIFCILFTMLWLIIKFYYPQFFSGKDRIIINTLIFISVFAAASRGALLSVFMFYALDYSVRKKNPLIVVGVIIIFVSFSFIDNITSWLYSIGLGKYLRAQTLENGSGRLVAFRYAWEQIKLSPFLGRGFGYSDWWFHLEDIEKILNALNHQGNTHNTYLTVLMDTGFVGLITFLFGWLSRFTDAVRRSAFGFPVLIIIIFSTNVETWLSASLNPFTIILIIILTLLTDKHFLNNKEQHP